jgi:hypothetical protein
VLAGWAFLEYERQTRIDNIAGRLCTPIEHFRGENDERRDPHPTRED